MTAQRILAGLALAAAVAGGCGQDSPPGPAGGSTGGTPVPAVAPGSRPAGGQPAGDVVRGRQLYMAQCVACHNNDPAKPGPVGPPIRGASSELLTAKVVHGTYPEGYKPQRDSRVMPPRPDLAPNIPDLAVYLR
jgi:mono/diheme cytochrome c family protein